MKKNSQNKLIAIVGPTASGKTGLALELAKLYKAEVVSADSRQIYREMDIGTAKEYGVWRKHDGREIFEIKGVVHHMIDITNPDEEYTLVNYRHDALQHIGDILARHRLPMLVGGTGLYIDAVLHNYTFAGGKPDKKYRAILEGKSIAILYKELSLVAPDMAAKVDKNNKRRLIRALELAQNGEREFSCLQQKGESPFDTLKLCILVAREELYERIDRRVDEMLEKGLESEVKTLLRKYDSHLPSMSGIGYRQMVEYLNGKISLAEAVRMIQRDTRRYARRQLTWFRRDADIHWVQNVDEARDLVSGFLAGKYMRL